jgi:cob(I)alamin adenosyltransferase
MAHQRGLLLVFAGDGKAEEGGRAAVKAKHSGKYDILILDEINNAIDYGMTPLEAVLPELRARPEKLHVICTGRGAPERMLEAADLATEMREIKHPCNNGVRA